MTLLDFVAADLALYLPPASPELAEVPPMQYLMIDGQGAAAGNRQLEQSAAVLFTVAERLRLLAGEGLAPKGYQDFARPPLEALWWLEPGPAYRTALPESWRWTLLLRLPPAVTPAMVRLAIGALVSERRDDVYVNVRLESLREGRVVQLLHHGISGSEQEDLARLDAYVAAAGLRYRGKLHEIYYGGLPTTNHKLRRTVLRRPVTDDE